MNANQSLKPELRKLYVQITYDIKNGLRKNLLKFILFFTLIILMSIYFYIQARSYAFIHGTAVSVGFYDYALNIFCGIKEYIPGLSERFEIPYRWFFVNIFLLYIIGNYAVEDLHEFGQHLFLRTSKKFYWVLSKAIYCGANALVVYVLIFLTMFVLGIITSFNDSLFNLALCRDFLGIDLINISSNQLIVPILILPFLTSIALCIIYLILSLLFKPMVSFIIMAVYIIASAYYQSYFLIGNYTMLLRNEKFVYGGFNEILCIVIDTIIIGASIISLNLLMKKYEIISKR